MGKGSVVAVPPVAPIYARTSSATNIGSNFLEAKPFIKPQKYVNFGFKKINLHFRNLEPPAILKPEELPTYSWARFIDTSFTKENGDYSTVCGRGISVIDDLFLNIENSVSCVEIKC